MTESTATQPSIRDLRHDLRNLASGVAGLVSGREGLNKDMQIAVLDKTIEIIDTMRMKAQEARDTAFIRDFDAYQEQKKAAKAEFEGTLSGILAAEQDQDDQEDDDTES